MNVLFLIYMFMYIYEVCSYNRKNKKILKTYRKAVYEDPKGNHI